MKATYRNRYGDQIIFEQDGDTVKMTGYESDFLRVGYSDDLDGCSSKNTENEIIGMVDPSGGPYLTTGSDLSLFWGDKQPRIIKSINVHKGYIEFKIYNLK